MAAPPAEVWDRVSTFEGVNHELGPWLKMTAPPHVRRLDAAGVRPGERLCRSWLLR